MKNDLGATYPMIPFKPLVLVDVRDVSLTIWIIDLKRECVCLCARELLNFKGVFWHTSSVYV